MKIINKTGIKGLNVTEDLVSYLEDAQYYDGKSKEEFSLQIDHSFSNNGNTWERSTFNFRKTKKGYVVE